jgi:uncharacterized BrkB/YihY/UPF0761 family membrane protein
MGWKNLSYWLKGGVFGLILGLLVVLFGQLTSSPADARVLTLYLTWAFIPGLLFICALIGWIYGKIKNRKR